MRHRRSPRSLPAPALGCLALAAGLLLPAPGPAQVVLGQTDTFENNTTQNWANGGINPGVSVQLGGPAGAADHFLQIQSGPGNAPRLTAFNRSQWLGNYVAAGVTAVAMDLKNFGTTPLTVRLAFKSGIASALGPGYSSNGFDLPADGQWHRAVFPLNDANFTPINNPPQPFSTFIAGQEQEMRILHAVQAALNGDRATAQLGVDNIQAVPEPGSLALVAAAGALAGPHLWRRRRSRRPSAPAAGQE